MQNLDLNTIIIIMIVTIIKYDINFLGGMEPMTKGKEEGEGEEG
jgi:hypothetical protein